MAITVVKMTQISMTMLEGIISSWLKEEGDYVEKDEPLVDVETDKIVSQITSPTSGYIRKIFAQENDGVPVGDKICIIAEENEDISEYLSDSNVKVKEIEKVEAEETSIVQSSNEQAGRRKISPLAKRIALAENIDFSDLEATGTGGLIVKADIEKAISQREETSVVAPMQLVQSAQDDIEYDVIPLEGIRKVTADQMTISKQQTAAVTTFAEVDMTKVGEYRKYISTSYTSYVVQATIKALKEEEFEIMNSAIVGNEIHVKKQINMNIAVATENSLVTPVIQNAGEKNILSISDDIDDLARRARDKKLTAEDFENGTFTVTNSGVFGALMFTPIINYPQCAILGMGKLMKTPVIREDEIVVANMMHLCLTYDHRIVDGGTSVKFLQRVKHYLENPEELIRK